MTSLKNIDLSDVDVCADDPIVHHRYMAAVMMAARPIRCTSVQYRGKNAYKGDTWVTCTHDNKPIWDWSMLTYRIDPATKPKKMVTWDKPGDIPMPVCWMRHCNDKMPKMVTGLYADGFCLDSVGNMMNECAFYEYSIDGKTWLPCEKEAT